MSQSQLTDKYTSFISTQTFSFIIIARELSPNKLNVTAFPCASKRLTAEDAEEAITH